MAMNEVGLLAAFLPEWEHIVCRWQHVMYHTYTVDVHSIFLVEELRRLWLGKYEQALPELTELMQAADDRVALFLGCLLHDIGKGFGGDHSKKGVERAGRAWSAWGSRPNAASGSSSWCEHHLLMSHLAQRRDLSDPKLILEFAAPVGDRTNLRDLYLLTFADMRASSSTAWTEWKGQLLRELFERTSEFLETGSDDPRKVVELIERRVEARREAAARELRGLGVGEADDRGVLRDDAAALLHGAHAAADRASRAGRAGPGEGSHDVDGDPRDARRLLRVHPVHEGRARSLRERRRRAHGPQHQHPRRPRLHHAHRAGARGLPGRHAAGWRGGATARLGGIRAVARGGARRRAGGGAAARAHASARWGRPPRRRAGRPRSRSRTRNRTSTRSWTSRRTTGSACCTTSRERSREHGYEIYISKAATVLDQVADTFYLKDRDGKKLRDPKALERLREDLLAAARLGEEAVGAERSLELAGAVDGFLAHASVERGLAPRTIEAYARDLARFASFLDGRGVRRLADVRREHLTGFLEALEAAGSAPAAARGRWWRCGAGCATSAPPARCARTPRRGSRCRASSGRCRTCCAPTRRWR